MSEHIPIGADAGDVADAVEQAVDSFPHAVTFEVGLILPTSDPVIVGAMWNDSGEAVFSEGGPVAAFQIRSGGSGYAVDDTGTIDAGTDDATYVVTTVDEDGAVTELFLDNYGSYYSNGEVSTTTPGGEQAGTGSGLVLVLFTID